MKKILLLTLVLVLMCLQSFADTRATVLLLHNGQGISFDADQLQTAVNEAMDGDTICLSEGDFTLSDTLRVNKVVTIMGAGETSRIKGCIKIDIDNAPSLSNDFMKYVRVSDYVFVTKELHGLKFRKCWFDRHFYATATLTDLLIDRCYLMCFVPTSSIKSALVTNSILYCVGDEEKERSKQIPWSIGNELTFFNCSIGVVKVLESGTHQIRDVAFVNSIICVYNTIGNKSISNNKLTNTLYNSSWVDSSDIMTNCYKPKHNLQAIPATANGWFPRFTMDGEDITEELLKENVFWGNDGTIVGAYGGNSPYSLEADGIHVKESVLKVDPATRQLNVTLKVE